VEALTSSPLSSSFSSVRVAFIASLDVSSSPLSAAISTSVGIRPSSRVSRWTVNVV
jgi:hypothetical protein